MLAPLNSTMIAVALPRIAADFGASPGASGWLVIAYLVAVAGVQPVAGKLGDRLGRRWLVLGGLLGFALTSCGAALAPHAPDPDPGVAHPRRGRRARSSSPTASPCSARPCPAAARASRFGLVGAAVSCAAAGGPPLGGLLVGQAGWRAVFVVNLVLAIPALLLGWRALPHGRPTRARGIRSISSARWPSPPCSSARRCCSPARRTCAGHPSRRRSSSSSCSSPPPPPSCGANCAIPIPSSSRASSRAAPSPPPTRPTR